MQNRCRFGSCPGPAHVFTSACTRAALQECKRTFVQRSSAVRERSVNVYCWCLLCGFLSFWGRGTKYFAAPHPNLDIDQKPIIKVIKQPKKSESKTVQRHFRFTKHACCNTRNTRTYVYTYPHLDTPAAPTPPHLYSRDSCLGNSNHADIASKGVWVSLGCAPSQS